MRTLLSIREKSVRRDEDHDEAQRARMYMQQDEKLDFSHPSGYRWPILQPDGSILWATWSQMREQVGTSGNSYDEINARLSDLMAKRD